MLKVKLDDTIAAISTPTGNGGIGIVRISGSEAVDIADRLFVGVGGKRLSEQKSHTLHYGRIVSDGKTIDEVIVSLMLAPKTYTREDVVEINTHGGYRAVTAVLNCVIAEGARLAVAGEFTKRAFLNGRLDLTQAEAVIDIINSKTDKSREAAVARLEGRLATKVKSLRERLLTLIAHIEAAIDYPEHDDEMMTYRVVAEGCCEVKSEIKSLIASADTGRIYREGIRTVILGRPNVGKSSLLNALLEEDRAIVTDIPGTTRDTLEEMINIGGIPLNIIDTAGIRDTDNPVERIGVERSRELAGEADLVLLVLDGSRELSDEDRALVPMLEGKRAIVIVNKADLECVIDFDEVERLVGNRPITLSAKYEKGLEELYEQVKAMFIDGSLDTANGVMVSNERNKASLVTADKCLDNVLATIESGMPEDLMSMDLTQAYELLGEITGETLEDDIIDKIFSEFCLGK
jgi:tRNA modification GTPase